MNNSDLSNLKIFRVIRLFRLMKLLRVLRGSKILKKWESQLEVSFAVIKLSKFVVAVMMLAHFMGCVWGAIPQFEEFNDDEESWMDHYNLGDDTVENYISSLYWAVMTLTTIGYGDILPRTTAERIVCIIGMMIGGGVYAYVVGAVCGIVASMDEATTEFNQQLDHLNVYMKKVNTPTELKVKLRQYIMHSKDLLHHKYFSRVVTTLSPGLRGQFANHTSGAWVRRISFFNGGPADEDVRFMDAITQHLKAELYPPGEALVSPGEPTNKLFIISKGLVARLGRVYRAGDVLGEDVILTHGTRHYSINTLTYVDCYTLSRKDLNEVLCGAFPHKIKNIRKAAVYMALQRKMQHLFSEMKALRMLGTSNPEFERNWLRMRLLGGIGKRDIRQLSIASAIESATRAQEYMEKALHCGLPLSNKEAAYAASSLLNTTIEMLTRCQTPDRNKLF